MSQWVGNGGDLIYMLACRFPHVIKASVSVPVLMKENFDLKVKL